MKCNWRTTLCGMVTAAAAFVAMYGPDLRFDARVIALGKFAMAGGLSCLGIVAKDSEHGDTK